MDMKKILTNMDDAASGNKPSTASADSNGMKTILESINKIDEGGMPMPTSAPSMPAPEMDKGNPVSVNVSMNASGKEHVADLLDMMKNAGLGGAQEVSKMPSMDMDASPMRMDIEKFRDIVDGPKDEAVADDGDEDEMPDMDDSDEDEKASEEWDNSPDEQYRDTKYMTKDISGGLNGEKPRKALRVKDPALESIKESLWKALKEKKSKPDFLDMDKDGDKKEPMKKAIKDKKAKKVGEAKEEDKMPSKAHVMKMCKDGKTKAEICKMHPDCDQAKLKAMIDDCQKEKKESVQEKTIQLPTGKEMKKCADDGMSKKEIMDKYKGCDKDKLEKLYASSCGSH